MIPVKNLPKFKFRAKLSEVDGGGYVHGYIIYRYDRVYIEDALSHEVFPVEEETVRQLVGRIMTGEKSFAEVYEGDEVEVENGTCYASVLRFLKTEKNSNLDFDECAKKYGWKLKK